MSLMDKNKAQVQNLIDIANEKTGNADTELTSAITALINGYGASLDTIVVTENVNHVLTATLTASSVEGGTDFNPSNAGDGNEDTRWSSKYPHTNGSSYGFDTDPWLKVEFANPTLIKQINLKLHIRQNSPAPSNISQFSIKYTDINNNVVYAKQNYKNTITENGYASNVTIILDEPIIAKDILLCEIVATASTWNNVGIKEIEVYSNNMGVIDDNNSNLLDYAVALNGMFGNTLYNNVEELNVSFGSKAQCDTSRTNYNRFVEAFYRIHGVRKLIVNCECEISEAQILQNTFSGTACEIIDISNFTQVRVSSWYRTFYYSGNIREIIGEIDFTDATDTTQGFMNLNALEEIRIKEGTLKVSTSFAQSNLLSDESIQSIINGLVDLTGQTSQTLTLHSDVKSKLTEEQLEQITSKNWTLA